MGALRLVQRVYELYEYCIFYWSTVIVVFCFNDKIMCVSSYTYRMVAMPYTLLLHMAAWTLWSTSYPNLVKRNLTRATRARHVWTWPFKTRSKMWWTGFFRRVGSLPINSRWAGWAPQSAYSAGVPSPHQPYHWTLHTVWSVYIRWTHTEVTGHVSTGVYLSESPAPTPPQPLAAPLLIRIDNPAIKYIFIAYSISSMYCMCIKFLRATFSQILWFSLHLGVDIWVKWNHEKSL